MTSDAVFMADYLAQSVQAAQQFSSDEGQLDILARMADRIVCAIRNGGKLLIAGNGGSAGDAQHIAAEFTGRMLYDRAPLAALALHVDSSALTAIGNDYGFDHVFARQVQALGRPGDVLLAISTSGRSGNILRALDAARCLDMITLGFSGASGGAMTERADLLLQAPSGFTPVIQQIHMIAGHLICALVERAIYPEVPRPDQRQVRDSISI